MARSKANPMNQMQLQNAQILGPPPPATSANGAAGQQVVVLVKAAASGHRNGGFNYQVVVTGQLVPTRPNHQVEEDAYPNDLKFVLQFLKTRKLLTAWVAKESRDGSLTKRFKMSAEATVEYPALFKEAAQRKGLTLPTLETLARMEAAEVTRVWEAALHADGLFEASNKFRIKPFAAGVTTFSRWTHAAGRRHRGGR